MDEGSTADTGHAEWDGDWIVVDYCEHPVRPWTVEERCFHCDKQATHKIADVDAPEYHHGLTAYVCCEWMRATKMDCSHGYDWFMVGVLAGQKIAHTKETASHLSQHITQHVRWEDVKRRRQEQVDE